MSELEQASIPTVLEDPGTQLIARMYARSLLDAAGSQSAGVVEELSSFVQDVIGTQPEFERVLLSPAVQAEQKLGLLEKVVSGRASEIFANFLRVLARRNRLSLLRSICTEAGRELEVRQGKQRALVKSAVALSDANVSAIRDRLKQALSKDAVIDLEVDPALLGGLVIRVGDTVYDGSVRTRIQQLRARMRERCVNEIQRGRDRFSHPEGN